MCKELLPCLHEESFFFALHAKGEPQKCSKESLICGSQHVLLTRSLRERAWRLEPAVEQLVVHYACDGWLLHASSDDAQRQLAATKAAAEAAARSEHKVCGGRCQDGTLQ